MDWGRDHRLQGGVSGRLSSSTPSAQEHIQAALKISKEKKKLNWKKKGGYNARGLVRWCRESKWPLSVLLTELKYISNTLETSVEKLECAFHLQFISSLEKITLCSLAPLTMPCCILPNHCLPPLLCIASDLSVSSPCSGSCLTCCYFPFHFYSLLWCLHPPLVHLWFLSPLPTSVHLFMISLSSGWCSAKLFQYPHSENHYTPL